MGTGYPNDWNSRRKDVYQRDDFRCQNCGRKGGPKGNTELHAHHVVPKSNGGSHELSNLKTLCKRCHKATHGDSIAPTGRSFSKNKIQRRSTESTSQSITEQLDESPLSRLEHAAIVLWIVLIFLSAGTYVSSGSLTFTVVLFIYVMILGKYLHSSSGNR